MAGPTQTDPVPTVPPPPPPRTNLAKQFGESTSRCYLSDIYICIDIEEKNKPSINHPATPSD